MEILPSPSIPDSVWDALRIAEKNTDAASGALFLSDTPDAGRGKALVQCDISTETVICAERADCPVHPESYNPRVFVRVMNPSAHWTHYELLQGGYFLAWAGLPPEGAPDYMLFAIEDLHCFSMIKKEKHPYQIEWENQEEL